MKVLYVCCKETTHAGKKYLSGQILDPGDPRPEVGIYWSIHQVPEEPAGRQLDSLATGASVGMIRWVPQPDRPTPNLTREEIAGLMRACWSPRPGSRRTGSCGG